MKFAIHDSLSTLCSPNTSFSTHVVCVVLCSQLIRESNFGVMMSWSMDEDKNKPQNQTITLSTQEHEIGPKWFTSSYMFKSCQSKSITWNGILSREILLVRTLQLRRSTRKEKKRKKIEWHKTLAKLEKGPEVAYQDVLNKFNLTWGVKDLLVTGSNLVVTWKVRPQMNIISWFPLNLRWVFPRWLYFGYVIAIKFLICAKKKTKKTTTNNPPYLSKPTLGLDLKAIKFRAHLTLKGPWDQQRLQDFCFKWVCLVLL